MKKDEENQSAEDKKECCHTKCIEFDSFFNISGLEFNFTALKCSICDTMIWSPQLEEEFHEWLKRQDPEHFIIEDIPIEANLLEFAAAEAKEHKIPPEEFLKICLNEYILCNKSLKFQKRVETMVLPSGDFEMVSLTFDPIRYLNLVENAADAEISDQEFTGRLIETILCIKQDTKNELRDEWIPTDNARYIKPYLSRRANEEVTKSNNPGFGTVKPKPSFH